MRKRITDRMNSAASTAIPFTSTAGSPFEMFAMASNAIPVKKNMLIFCNVSLNPVNMGIIMNTSTNGVVSVLAVTLIFGKDPEEHPDHRGDDGGSGGDGEVRRPTVPASWTAVR